MRNLVPALIVTLAITLTASLQAQSPAPAPASSLDGQWSFVMDSQMGAVSARVAFKTQGETVTGTMTLEDSRVWPIEKGVLKGQDLSFTVTRQRPTGGAMVYQMTGKVAGDTITGIAAAEFDGQAMELPWSMKRVK